MLTNTRYIVLIFFIVFSIVQNTKAELTPQEELSYEEIEFQCVYYPEEARQNIPKKESSFSAKQLESNIGYFNLFNAQLAFVEMQIDSSLLMIEKATVFFTRAENPKWLAKCQLLLGRISETIGLYEEAQINYYETINLLQDSTISDIGIAYLGLARSKSALKEDYKSELSRGVSTLKNDKRIEYQLYAQFMNLLLQENPYNNIDKLVDLANEYDKIKLYNHASNVYKSITFISFNNKQYQIALKYCKKAITYSKLHKAGTLIIPALIQQQGAIYYKLKNYDLAEKLFLESIDKYKENNQEIRSHYSLSSLHVIEKKRKNYYKAYNYLEQYKNIISQNRNLEKIRLSKLLEVNNNVRLLKSELNQVKAEKRANIIRFYLILFIVISALSVFVRYIYSYQIKKRDKLQQVNKELHNLLIGIGEKQLLERRLGVKTKTTVNIKDTSSDLLTSSFDSCYMETINLFKNAFPQLSPTEVRYSVMICLKLPTEIIIKVQNVQPVSIRKAKQRIRSKLNIKGKLDEYLITFREQQISSTIAE